MCKNSEFLDFFNPLVRLTNLHKNLVRPKELTMKPSALSYLGQIKYSYFQLRNLKCLGNKIKFATTYRSGRSKYTSVKQAVACTLYKVRKSYC